MAFVNFTDPIKSLVDAKEKDQRDDDETRPSPIIAYFAGGKEEVDREGLREEDPIGGISSVEREVGGSRFWQTAEVGQHANHVRVGIVPKNDIGIAFIEFGNLCHPK